MVQYFSSVQTRSSCPPNRTAPFYKKNFALGTDDLQMFLFSGRVYSYYLRVYQVIAVITYNTDTTDPMRITFSEFPNYFRFVSFQFQIDAERNKTNDAGNYTYRQTNKQTTNMKESRPHEEHHNAASSKKKRKLTTPNNSKSNSTNSSSTSSTTVPSVEYERV